MDLKPIFEKLFPEGSKGGQCAAFAEKLVLLPTPGHIVGDSLASKIDKVTKFGILAKNIKDDFREGDVIVTDESKKYGHLFVVNCVMPGALRATESNYNLDERVHHTRLISKVSPRIIGILRGTLKVEIPKPMQPQIKVPVRLIMNNCEWATLPAKLQECQDRILKASGDRLLVEFDVVHSQFNSIPFVPFVPTADVGFVEGYKGIPNDWYDQNVDPLIGRFPIAVFQVNDKQWQGGAAKGWRTDADEGAIEIQIGSDEGESIYAEKMGTMWVFVNSIVHEITHALFYMQGGFDYTHTYLSNLTGIFDLEKAFSFLNYDLINNYLQKFMNEKIVYKKIGDPTLYLAVGDVLFGFAVSWEQFQKNVPGVQIKELSPEEFAKKVVSPDILLKPR